MPTAALNRTVLARQLLIERAPAAIDDALERMGGLQAQYAPSMYIGLWSRVAGFTRDQLDDALLDRSVVQGTLLRATIHLVSTADYWAFAVATRAARRAWWLRVQRSGATEVEMLVLAERARALMADGPVDQAALSSLADRERLGGLHQVLDIVRVPPSGTWARRRADVYVPADRWIGPEPRLAVDAAVDHLLDRYLGAFGPAPVGDAARWAGLAPAVVRASFARVGAIEVGDGRFDRPGALVLRGDEPVPVRFLPTWDALLLAHARRAEVLREEDRPRIFTTKLPQSLPTFLVDGVVAGTWRHADGRIELDPWRPLGRSVERAVRAEADRLAGLHE
jgi:hypothetical protein